MVAVRASVGGFDFRSRAGRPPAMTLELQDFELQDFELQGFAMQNFLQEMQNFLQDM
jgi:hypothetical protein